VSLADVFKDPKVLGAIITALLAIAGVSGGAAVNANSERDDALERSREEIRRDIDWGYQLCRSQAFSRVERGKEGGDIVPPVPNKTIDRLANEASQAE
jgi:DNA-binding transcriptional regulator YdaS (Cro superfamily)